MHSLTLLLIPLLFLSSCSIDWNNEKDAKIAELQKQVTELKRKNDDELFKKNKECEPYLKKMDGKLDIFSETDFGYTENRIFYSEVKNTCIYQAIWTKHQNISSNRPGKCFIVKNMLTNEEYVNMCYEDANSEDAKKEQIRYDNIYENWRSVENFDKAIQKLN